ncbi:shiftless antiviral inhibitor of ribosomal frameshifting protein homolog [Biomphalaria glabrata]|uniref:Shiftless antiviral inhibitor of ribosomal frameshifting protein homolog n=1 Tax=Biomphalaria glabrata TaxID=6526 RepID=A0A9W2ZAT1_BIOGL|nr:shiftless antiviral inhibitor of ribosomal frameshifting protein homolog [Biomphalaria glabrata]
MEGKDIHYKAHCLRELFCGRFTQQEIVRVLDEFDEDEYQALDFLLTEDPAEVSRFLKRTTNYIETLQEDSKELREFLETSEIVVKPSERLFACMTCNRSWWKKVPYRKEVSKCKVCLIRYEAIPKDKEWGVGIFHCQTAGCGKQFRGWAIMGMTQSRCHQCHVPVTVSTILSHKKSERTWKARDTHECNGINCYNRNIYVTGGPQTYSPTDRVPICAHPKSRHLIPPGSTFLIWSVRHSSSGSTVSTFMDQGSISSRSGIVAATPHRQGPEASSANAQFTSGPAVLVSYRPPQQQHSMSGWVV